MVVLRPARLDDLAALRALETACFGRDAWSESALRDELAAVPGTRFVVVAVDRGQDEEVVGYASLFAVAETADVQRIAVRPDWRRRGVGRRLLRALLDEADLRGCREALLEVRADNAAAIAMYERAGFEAIARRPGYYRGEADALVLRLAPLHGSSG
ncbi:ribosomal protein S18-alanine N-acetyltransferase [Thermasporomyces composti]|jgi:ribosomal-protein-alanine N-acetyltransferase|uniref:Ribosomal-protein-alanine N-acetyltransferase n=1 Tax=Thermasporomyces composti TaxID=696763 RepID=A0A3D9VJ71_THECX|nr:ribosomal protein S18-alanine N-acetyltransferase [Thermasporomyces composti]REF37371.1 ribosomal-protein-alanine N-acetyltransferase [Thermasporomyces composti]